jgi:hypothetical protein
MHQQKQASIYTRIFGYKVSDRIPTREGKYKYIKIRQRLRMLGRVSLEFINKSEYINDDNKQQQWNHWQLMGRP